MRKQYYDQISIDKAQRWADWFKSQDDVDPKLITYIDETVDSIKIIINFLLTKAEVLPKLERHKGLTALNKRFKLIDSDLERIDRGERMRKLYEEHLKNSKT